MFLEALVQRSIFKYVTVFALIGTVLLLAEQAWTFIQNAYAGIAPTTESIGTFVLFAALCPLYMAFLVRIRLPRQLSDADEGGTTTFSETPECRMLNVVSVWSIGVAIFVKWVASGGDTSDLFGWFSPAFFVLMVAASGAALMRRLLCLELSPAGLKITPSKAGLIAWSDIREIKLVERFGSRWINVSVDNRERYGLKKATFSVMPGFLGTTAEQLHSAIERRRALFAQKAPA
ncbi:MAG: hypothetical protein HYU58_11920 [Proteobacteria bacterium]|nr:hypothetical protein [Pseudomonadota bacterium]